MKLCRQVAVWILCGTVFTCAADPGFVITSFTGNGSIEWTYPTNGVTEYRIEWCADLEEGLWCDVESGMRGVDPTGDVMSARVPMYHRIKALPPAPSNMVYVPAGWFRMGDNFEEGGSDEVPVHSVYVSAFYMDRFEVSNDKMRDVMQWAYDQGEVTASTATVQNVSGDQQELLDIDESYCRLTWDGVTFGVKSAKGTNYPCVEVTWYGACAYCNFKSEMEGLSPCYDFNDWSCNWSNDGYRLPTEAEWEKAARGGLNGQRFPSSTTITHLMANYYSTNC